MDIDWTNDIESLQASIVNIHRELKATDANIERSNRNKNNLTLKLEEANKKLKVLKFLKEVGGDNGVQTETKSEASTETVLVPKDIFKQLSEWMISTFPSNGEIYTFEDVVGMLAKIDPENLPWGCASADSV